MGRRALLGRIASAYDGSAQAHTTSAWTRDTTTPQDDDNDVCVCGMLSALCHYDDASPIAYHLPQDGLIGPAMHYVLHHPIAFYTLKQPPHGYGCSCGILRDAQHCRRASRLLDSAVDTSCGRSVGLDKVVSRSQPQPAVAGKFCGRISAYYLIDVISIKCNDS